VALNAAGAIAGTILHLDDSKNNCTMPRAKLTRLFRRNKPMIFIATEHARVAILAHQTVYRLLKHRFLAI
jgi:hypothetical protein